MKILLKKILFAITYFLFKVFPPKLFSFLEVKLNQLYSLWKSNQFSNRKNCFIAYPMYLRGGKYITIGENCDFDKRLRLDAYDNYLGDTFSPEINIGNNVSIQMDCHIGAINKIIIGNGVLLASKVFISDHSHGNTTMKDIHITPVKRKLHSKGPVVIEDNVWIGESVTILPGVTIGENSIIGANSVVTKSIPRNCVAAGNPARILKKIEIA